MAEVRLTAREIDVFRFIASHIKKMYRKLGVHSSGAAVMQATRLGIIE